MGVRFEFVAHGFYFGVAQQELHFRNGHIRGADVFNQAHFNQFLQLPPRFHVVLVDVGFCVRVARRNVDAFGMKVGEGPMYQVQVEILEPEVFEGFFT